MNEEQISAYAGGEKSVTICNDTVAIVAEKCIVDSIQRPRKTGVLQMPQSGN